MIFLEINEGFAGWLAELVSGAWLFGALWPLALKIALTSKPMAGPWKSEIYAELPRVCRGVGTRLSDEFAQERSDGAPEVRLRQPLERALWRETVDSARLR